MAINEREFNIEKKILKKTGELVNKTIDSLGITVKKEKEGFKEFQKLMWSDYHSFDDAENVQVITATKQEANSIIRKDEYYKKLSKIRNKPYFASIIFEDDEKKWNIYLALTYLRDEKYNNILYDWRSPICSLFYDYEIGPCSYKAPEGIITGKLHRKRQYIIENNYLINVFDNSLNIEDDMLQMVLAEESNERMKNIVNTIQQEQNKVIRNLDNDNLIVQGIAGSGKTSVALHRIAFLLYRLDNLSSKNILIFSPNNIFTEYISNVLPELGENNTLQTTFNDYMSFFLNEYKGVEEYTDFIARYYSYTEDNTALVKYKQSDNIIDDLNNYLEDYIANAECLEDIIETDAHVVLKEEVNEMIQYRYNRLPLFERMTEIAEKLSSNFYKGSNKKKKTYDKLLREACNFKKDFKEIYKNFFKSTFCKYKLSDIEIKQFLDKDIINYEDACLLTYIKGILEGFKYEGNIKQVVIDEAQDYNRLQYIIIENIFKKADFTILGDINQNINPYYKYNSLEDLKDIFKGDSIYLELMKTYRSSPEIIDYTNKILGLKHVNAIRNKTGKNVVRRTNLNTLTDDIKYLNDTYKSLAIITKDLKEANKIYNLIKDNFNISLIDNKTVTFNKDLVIIPSYLAKGLEFDSVIVYNNRENTYKANERNLLYVACTRSQHELYIYN